MGYREGEGLGKHGQISEDNKQKYAIKDEMSKVQNNASQPESTYSDFAQRQMVLLDLHVLSFMHSCYYRYVKIRNVIQKMCSLINDVVISIVIN